MILLIFFALLAGVVTILSPCILPILPIILSGSLTGGKKRPLGIIAGFIVSFTFFTLFLTTLVKAIGLSADTLRTISVVIIAAFGASLLIPKFQVMIERLFSKLSTLAAPKTPPNPEQQQRSDFITGIFVGISLGLVWTPCVGPILAAIITLAATSTITAQSVAITLAYSIGTAIPLLAITYGGRRLLTNVPWLLANSARIQKAFGVIMILTALLIYFQLDRKFQAYILEKFPNYGVGLTKLEENTAVKGELKKLQKQPMPEEKKGKPMFDFLESDLGTAPDFIPGGQWFNSKPLSIKNLRGKVVLVDFWTYTCINCIRTLPYIKSWWAKYKDKGLVIVGVHTPEFEFEKNPTNVAKAIKDFGLTYPIVQDNDYATWNAYANRYWPAKYFIDATGKIRYTHFGEGNYDESEERIQKLLKEAGLLTEVSSTNNPTYTVAARTPETYLGSRRIDRFASPEGIDPNVKKTYSIPKSLPSTFFAYGGEWIVGDEYAMPTKGAQLVFHFDSKEVFLVMRPKLDKGKVKVTLDGKLVSEITVDTDRLYELVKLEVAGDHTLTLEFLDDNLELYAFTFG
ncbi:cytochrome c biogenesis protein DipZ [Candidatus Gottesmanbacteria bacterium]|nr:cytochrome c biogenesis protein DipZ [Candidatus Gottesmanbacteria bacterium]